MNPNLQTLLKACDQLEIQYQIYHGSRNLIQVQIEDQSFLFLKWTTPLNPHSVVHLCRDKDHFYQFFIDVIQMPKTKAFLHPEWNPKFNSYMREKNIEEIVAVVEQEFQYPLIVKKNSGTLGINVFKPTNSDHLIQSLKTIFNTNSSYYDYVALVQDYIPIEHEYRVIYLDGQLSFAYEKSTRDANFIGNLSPLHWENSRALLVKDNNLLSEIAAFCQPIFKKFKIPFCGLDIGLDTEGNWWLIEANSSPGFDYIIQHGGEAVVIQLYLDMLQLLQKGCCHLY